MHHNILILLVLIQLSSISFAASEGTKGLLSEISLSETNEEENQTKSFQSEVMITKTENKAIETLKILIKKKGNTHEEADLLYRLAELYMRRAKSGRYFDLDLKSENKLKTLGLKNQKANEALKQAIQIYNQIIKKFPKFNELDYVYFNSALAYSQIKNTEAAKSNYLYLIKNYPHSELISDALLEVGEIYYQQQNFNTALEKFKEIEKFQNSRAYPYGLYKSAWCFYNLKNTDAAIAQLLLVLKQNPADSKDLKKFNLRKESLRDLTLFAGESISSNKIISFFQEITTSDELGEAIYGLTQLYESHSRFKEITQFTEEFIEKFPKHTQAPKIYAKLIQTHETLKTRDQVIKKLTLMSKFCLDNKENNTHCIEEFKKVSLEISKKWWEIWLKNKNNVEFSSLTEKAFEVLLSVDTPENPNSNSRFAFAELLFQQNKFNLSAVQYEMVSQHNIKDLSLKHDALYGALFSIEKQITNQENKILIAKQKELAHRYILEFKNGEHIHQITYRLGFIYYKESQFEAALSLLEPLLTQTKIVNLKTLTQDIILDIYNLKKDYVTLKLKANLFKKETTDNTRLNSLSKIAEEAHYTQLQIEAKNLPINKQIELLLTFANEHSASHLGQSAHWQSISLAYSNGYDVWGAELSLSYYNKYPKDEKNTDALKDASNAFLNAGHLDKTKSILNILNIIDKKNASQYIELTCELNQLQNNLIEAQKCYTELFLNAEIKNKTIYLEKVLPFYTDKKDTKYKVIENQIFQYSLEPYATEILIKQAQELLNSNKSKEAFALSLKINARNVDEDVRAEARLIQARILENEFVAQSIKAREDRLALVISMKTEKLDKSFTAYSSAIKMSKSNKIQVLGLQGIDRLYSHFIDSLTSFPLPETLSADDKKTLMQEFLKIAEPFVDKRKNNALKLVELNQDIINAKSENWFDNKIEESIAPKIDIPRADKFAQYYLADFNSDNFSRADRFYGKCDALNLTANNINICLHEKKYDLANNLALQLAANKTTRLQGLYYLSLIAEAQSNLNKALWMINKALALNSKFLPAQYQKWKVLYSVENFNTAFKYFENVFFTQSGLVEIQILRAIKHFSDRDYSRVIEEFSRLSSDQIYNYGMELIHIESKLKAGEIDSAIKIARQHMSKSSLKVEHDLIMARIYESFIKNKEQAIMYYKSALNKVKKEEQKNWLTKKIEYLKITNTQISSNVGGAL